VAGRRDDLAPAAPGDRGADRRHGRLHAEQAGQDVVEPHRESEGGMGHEEVYVVLRGRASFTLDGEALDAPAGTVVRVDPEVHRHAVAAEGGTTVLALGRGDEAAARERLSAADPRYREALRADPDLGPLLR
jgi:mannose-6-phosphate isomerase-like protein (cupin superfamily)